MRSATYAVIPKICASEYPGPLMACASSALVLFGSRANFCAHCALPQFDGCSSPKRARSVVIDSNDVAPR
jgi:hypothetical protein